MDIVRVGAAIVLNCIYKALRLYQFDFKIYIKNLVLHMLNKFISFCYRIINI